MGRKSDLKQVDAVAKRFGIDRDDYGDYLEDCKASGDHGTANDLGDFTWAELCKKASEYKDTFK